MRRLSAYCNELQSVWNGGSARVQCRLTCSLSSDNNPYYHVKTNSWVQRNPQSVPIPSKMNVIDSAKFYGTPHFNIILPSKSRSRKLYLSFRFCVYCFVIFWTEAKRATAMVAFSLEIQEMEVYNRVVGKVARSASFPLENLCTYLLLVIDKAFLFHGS
jgi:hypothetical protein